MKDYTSYAKQPLSFEVLPAGGYVAKIVEVDDRDWSGHKEKAHMLQMDIAEGEHMALYARNNKGADANRWLSYWFAEPNDGSPEWMLSKVGGIQTSLAESNSVVDLSDPRSWKNKYIGVVVGNEEVESKSGTVYERPYVSYVCSVDRIRKGDYKIPKVRKLPTITMPVRPVDVPDSFSAVEDDIPF